jgi:hypothetical protein
VSVLADIETRLAALEALVGAQAVDTLQPNYLTVNPDGSIGADFTGVINARGILMPEVEQGQPLRPSSIIWQRASDGAYTAQIYQLQDNPAAPPGTRDVVFRAFGLDTTESSSISLRADYQDPPRDTSLPGAELGVQQENGTATHAAFVANSNGMKTILDQAGASDFLQLAVLEQLALSVGVAVLNFPAVSQFATAVTVNHGLGRVPDVALGAPRTPNSFYVLPNVVEGSVNANTFQLTAFAPQGNPGNVNVGVTWFAIG